MEQDMETLETSLEEQGFQVEDFTELPERAGGGRASEDMIAIRALVEGKKVYLKTEFDTLKDANARQLSLASYCSGANSKLPFKACVRSASVKRKDENGNEITKFVVWVGRAPGSNYTDIVNPRRKGRVLTVAEAKKLGKM